MAPAVAGRIYHHQHQATQSGLQMFNYTAMAQPFGNCTFANNQGYAFDLIDANSIIENCVFVSNYFASLDIRSGAAPTLSGCLFTNNSTVEGNVQILLQSSPLLTNCLFVNNTDTHVYAREYPSRTPPLLRPTASSRAIRLLTAPLRLEMSSSTGLLVNSLMANNTATYSAGAIQEAQSSLRILLQKTISRNTGESFCLRWHQAPTKARI